MNLLYVLFSLDMLNLAVFLPAFSPFIRSLGGTPFSLGLINSSSALVSLLWNPVVGSLSDQVGRKGLLIKCLIASAIGSLIMACSSSLTLVFIGKSIGALGSAVGILLRSIVADNYKTPEEKKSFFNKSAPFISSAFLVGSLSSGFLSEAKNGYSLAFLLMASIMGIAAVIANKTIPNDIKSKKKRKEESSFASKATKEIKSAVFNLKTISWPRYKDLFYFKGLYDFSIGMIVSNVGLLLINEFGVKGRVIGYVFLMISICKIVSNILTLKLKNTLSQIPDDVKMLRSGLVLLISYIAMYVSTSLVVFLPALGVMCILRAFIDTTLIQNITTRTTENDRGKVIGAYENLYPVAMFAAPLLSGVLAEAFGQRILIATAVLAKTSLANDSKESRVRRKNKTSVISQGLHEIKKAIVNVIQISWPRYRNLFIIKGCYDFALGMLTANLGFIMLNEFNIKGRYMGYVFLMISIVSIISNILKLKLKTFFDAITDYQMLIKGGLLLAASFIGMSIPSNVYVFLFFLTSMCIARAFLDTTFTEIITTATTEEDRGKVIGAYENLMPLASIIAPILSGSLAEAFGERVLVISAAIPMGIVVLLTVLQKNKKD